MERPDFLIGGPRSIRSISATVMSDMGGVGDNDASAVAVRLSVDDMGDAAGDGFRKLGLRNDKPTGRGAPFAATAPPSPPRVSTAAGVDGANDRWPAAMAASQAASWPLLVDPAPGLTFSMPKCDACACSAPSCCRSRMISRCSLLASKGFSRISCADGRLEARPSMDLMMTNRAGEHESVGGSVGRPSRTRCHSSPWPGSGTPSAISYTDAPSEKMSHDRRSGRSSCSRFRARYRLSPSPTSSESAAASMPMSPSFKVQRSRGGGHVSPRAGRDSSMSSKLSLPLSS
mmetsp:Transcript_9097/g.28963  ORF Transcript_9097/g.28963 Transcript_9097/m.28963 type:complete len:288 (+) Transcript_9097:1021-1884(+)